MSKRIVFCADGTWDSPASDTNVCKIYQALISTPDQIAFYDPGVGTGGDILKSLIGGAFGDGLFRKIKDGYVQIAHVYDKGDEIFIFGFSRGSYTARSLAGMIAVCGLPTRNFDGKLIDLAFQAYRDKDDRPMLLEDMNATYAMDDAGIQMLGVWDTVGALGIPAVIGGVDPILYGFLDTSLHPDVRHAYHAVSIDERRCEFPATLWSSPPAAGQVMEQVYFCGVHESVGGGGKNPGLPGVTLAWMMNKAATLGLQFQPAVAAQLADDVDPKHALDAYSDSWHVWWGFPKARNIDDRATLSNSVVLRCEHDPSYRPRNLKRDANGAPAADYKIVNVVGAPAPAAAAAGSSR